MTTDARVVLPQEEIEELFDDIAVRYDLFNTLASGSLDAWWRRRLAGLIAPGSRVLDIGCGTGPLTFRLARRVGASGRVVGVDVSQQMLSVASMRRARRTMQARFQEGRIAFVRGSVAALPVPDASYDYIVSAFVTRNLMSQLNEILAELRRVLAPGGRVVFLDMTRPRNRLLQAAYHGYMKCVIPGIGWALFRSRKPFDYLARSVVGCIEPDELCRRLAGAGFGEVAFYPLTGGLVGIHTARTC